MRRGMKQARHRLFCLLLVGLLLCSVLPVTVHAQNETGISETEAAAQTEDSGSADSPGETEITGGPDNPAEIEPPTDETDEVPDGDAEKAAGGEIEAAGLLDAENEETLLELTTFGAAAAMSSPDEVSDLGELEAWLAANPEGGTVTLGGDIEVTDYLELEQVTIDAGDFGFIVTGTLVLCGGVSITGGGAAAPLIRVDGGVLKMFDANDVAATGEGGGALFLEAGSRYLAEDSARPVFRAEGIGSVAIQSEIPLDLKRHTIQAADGAGLIDSAEPVRLYLSRVEADGVPSLPPNVTLDTCIVSPSISGATVISREISEVKPSFPFFFFIGEAATGYFAGKRTRCTITLSAAGVGDEYEQAYICFDDSGVNYDAPGEYLLPGVLEPPYDDLYAFDIVTEICPVAITITVYDPAIPYFHTFGNYFDLFSISYFYSGEYDVLTLWRSDDGGESWRVYWKPGDEDSEKFIVECDYGSLHLIFLDRTELAAPALFVFEVGEGVGSDILYVDTQTVKSVGSGGDRDSGDRILLPWEFFFGNPEGNDDGGETGNTGDDLNSEPNTDSDPPVPEDETGSQGLGGSGGSNGSGGSGGNGRHDGDTNSKPDTAQLPVKDNNGGDNITADITPVAEGPGAILPPGIAPLDTPSDLITSTAGAGISVPVPGAPGEPDPATVEHEDKTTVAAAFTGSVPAEAMPEPISEPYTAPFPLFPILAAGFMGAGGLAYIFRKRRVKSVG